MSDTNSGKAEDIVSISEFRSLTRLDHKVILEMIESGELELTHDATLGWAVRLDKIETQQLRTSNGAEHNEEDKDAALREEVIASEVVNFLDSILDEALSLALCWYEKGQTSK